MLVRLATTPLAARGVDGTTPVVPPAAIAADLLTDIWDAMASAASLESLFGRPGGGPAGWLWFEADGPPRARVDLPYLIFGLDGAGAPRPETRGGLATQELDVRFETYHDTKGGAATLATAVLDFWGSRGTPRLEWVGGRELLRLPGRGALADPPTWWSIGGHKVWAQSFTVRWTAQVRWRSA